MSTPGPNLNPTRAPHTKPHPAQVTEPHSSNPPADLAPQSALLNKAAIKSKPATYGLESCGAKSTVSAVVPQPALTSEVITPAMELKPCNAGVFTPSVAPKPFDAVKVTPPA